MPAPTAALTTLRPDLGGSFMEWDIMTQEQGFIGTQVLPVFEANKQAGVFGTIPVEQLLQQRTTLRAPGGNYNRGNWTFTTTSYTCIEHGAEEPVDDREAAMYNEYFDAEQVAAFRAMSAVQRNAEDRIEAAVFNTTTWTGASLFTNVTNEWDDAANATPITDVEAAAQNVYNNSGMWPNALIIDRKVFRNLRLVDQIINRIASSGAGFPNRATDVTRAQLAAVFDLDFIIVAGVAKNTANEGQAASLSSVWDDEYAMVCRVATTNDIREPCIGRTIHWGEDGSTIGGTIETYRDEAVRSDIVRVRHDVDELILYAEMGHLLGNITEP